MQYRLQKLLLLSYKNNNILDEYSTLWSEPSRAVCLHVTRRMQDIVGRAFASCNELYIYQVVASLRAMHRLLLAAEDLYESRAVQSTELHQQQQNQLSNRIQHCTRLILLTRRQLRVAVSCFGGLMTNWLRRCIRWHQLHVPLMGEKVGDTGRYTSRNRIGCLILQCSE